MSLKNMLGKLAKKAIEEAPNLIAKAAANAAAEASKRHAELDRRSPSVERSYGNTSSEPKIGGLTLDQWDKRWVRLGKLENLTIENLKPYNKSIGLYKATENGTVEFINLLIGNTNPYLSYEQLSKKNIIVDLFYTSNVSPILVDEVDSKFFTSTAADKGERLIKDVTNNLDGKHPVFICTTNTTNFE